MKQKPQAPASRVEPFNRCSPNKRGKFKFKTAPHLLDSQIDAVSWPFTYSVRLPHMPGACDTQIVEDQVQFVTLPDTPGLWIVSPRRSGANALRALPLALEAKIRMLMLGQQLSQQFAVMGGLIARTVRQLAGSAKIDLGYSRGQIEKRRTGRLGRFASLAGLMGL